MTEEVPPTPPRTPKKEKEIELQGSAPKSEIICHQRWFIFKSSSDFRHYCTANLIIENDQTDTLAFFFKGKAPDNMLRVSPTCGLLAPGAKKTVQIVISTSEEWASSMDHYLDRRIRLCIETLKVKGRNTKLDMPRDMEKKLVRSLFQHFAVENPNERMYRNLNVVLMLNK